MHYFEFTHINKTYYIYYSPYIRYLLFSQHYTQFNNQDQLQKITGIEIAPDHAETLYELFPNISILNFITAFISFDITKINTSAGGIFPVIDNNIYRLELFNILKDNKDKLSQYINVTNIK